MKSLHKVVAMVMEWDLEGIVKEILGCKMDCCIIVLFVSGIFMMIDEKQSRLRKFAIATTHQDIFRISSKNDCPAEEEPRPNIWKSYKEQLIN